MVTLRVTIPCGTGGAQALQSGASPVSASLSVRADLTLVGCGGICVRRWKAAIDAVSSDRTSRIPPFGGRSIGSLPSSYPGVVMPMMPTNAASSWSDLCHVVCGSSAEAHLSFSAARPVRVRVPHSHRRAEVGGCLP